MSDVVSREQLRIADLVLRSMRTGDHAAAVDMAPHLHPDVVLRSSFGDAAGRDAVLHRLSGQWAFTPVYARGVWSAPQLTEGAIQVIGTFPNIGAAPLRLTLSLRFGRGGLVTSID